MYGKPHDGSQNNFAPQNRSGSAPPLDGQQGADGERGIGATLLGGAGGAFLGHKMEHGALGTLGGLAIGAIAANAFEHHEKKKKEEHREERSYDEGYERGERRGSRSRSIDDRSDYYRERPSSRSRGIDGDSDYYRGDRYEDEEDDYRPRHHHHHHHDSYDDYDRDRYDDDRYRDYDRY